MYVGRKGLLEVLKYMALLLVKSTVVAGCCFCLKNQANTLEL